MEEIRSEKFRWRGNQSKLIRTTEEQRFSFAGKEKGLGVLRLKMLQC